MLALARLPLACVCLAALIAAGCTTPQIKPKLSEAVADARAHRNAPPPAACPQTPLGEVSPVMVGFPFNEAVLSESMRQPLVSPAQWLSCHTATAVVIRPEADGHGSVSDQDALARGRAEAVRDYLVSNGVAAERIRILSRGQAEPTGDVFLVRAEGRRW